MRTGNGVRRVDSRRAQCDARRREGRRRHDAPGVSRRREDDRPPLRRRGRSCPPRPLHLPVAARRRTRAAMVADPALGRRSRGPAPRDRRVGRRDVRLPGPQPRPRCVVLRRLRRGARACSPRPGHSSATTSPTSTRRRATRACISATRSSIRRSIAASRRTSSTSPIST